MKKQQKKLMDISLWCAIVLFALRCLISWEDILTAFSIYDLFGYASEAVSVTVVFAVLYEKYLWRFNPLDNTPKLASRYSGTLKSNYDDIERQASLIIKQTLLSVHVTLITDESKSQSLFASIDEVLNETTLTCCYLNVPKSEYRNRSEIHYGTATLAISNPKKIDGQYYTDRQTIGDMVFIADS
jgi:hypothetical protein